MSNHTNLPHDLVNEMMLCYSHQVADVIKVIYTSRSIFGKCKKKTLF